MSSVDNQSEECKDGVCGTNFRPVQMARRSFQNLKAMAVDIIEKVKDSIAGDSIESAVRESGATAQKDQSQSDTTKERSTGTESGTEHLSAHSSAVLNSFIQNNWRPGDGPAPHSSPEDSPRLVHIQARPPENLIKAPHFDNPWRYDSRH